MKVVKVIGWVIGISLVLLLGYRICGLIAVRQMASCVTTVADSIEEVRAKYADTGLELDSAAVLATDASVAIGQIDSVASCQSAVLFGIGGNTSVEQYQLLVEKAKAYLRAVQVTAESASEDRDTWYDEENTAGMFDEYSLALETCEARISEIERSFLLTF